MALARWTRINKTRGASGSHFFLNSRRPWPSLSLSTPERRSCCSGVSGEWWCRLIRPPSHTLSLSLNDGWNRLVKSRCGWQPRRSPASQAAYGRPSPCRRKSAGGHRCATPSIAPTTQWDRGQMPIQRFVVIDSEGLQLIQQQLVPRTDKVPVTSCYRIVTALSALLP